MLNGTFVTGSITVPLLHVYASFFVRPVYSSTDSLKFDTCSLVAMKP